MENNEKNNAVILEIIRTLIEYEKSEEIELIKDTNEKINFAITNITQLENLLNDIIGYLIPFKEFLQKHYDPYCDKFIFNAKVEDKNDKKYITNFDWLVSINGVEDFLETIYYRVTKVVGEQYHINLSKSNEPEADLKTIAKWLTEIKVKGCQKDEKVH